MSDSLRQLDDLFAALRDGELTAAQRAELDALVASDPAALDRFIHLRLIQSGLTERFGEPRSIPFTPAASKPDLSPRRTPTLRPPKRLVSPLALAAALLLAAAALAIYAFLFNSTPETPDSNPAAPVAVLLSADSVAWLTEPLNPGAELTAQTLRIDAGSIELEFLDGASVTVTGPAEVQLAGRSLAHLRLGRLEARVVGGGFVVDTPRGVRVTDLSTEFAVTVDPDGATSVRVIDGRVRLSAGGSDTELGNGEARHVDATGAVKVIDAAAIAITGRSDATLLTPPEYADALRPLNPVAWLRFDTVSEGIATDASGLGHHARLIADATIARTGDAGSLLLPIAGVGHAVVDPAPALNAPGNRLTVAAWVNLADRDHQAVAHKWSDGFGYSLEVHDGKPGFVVAFANDYARVVHVKADQTMPIDRWVQLVGVYDGQIVSIYVDGELRASIAAPTLDAPVNASAGPVVIGARSDEPRGYAHGSIDELAVFTTALTPQQVADLFAAMHRD